MDQNAKDRIIDQFIGALPHARALGLRVVSIAPGVVEVAMAPGGGGRAKAAACPYSVM